MAKPAWVERWQQANIAPLYAAMLIALVAFVIGTATLGNVSVDPNARDRIGEILTPRITPVPGAERSNNESAPAWIWFGPGSHAANPDGFDSGAAPKPPDNEVLAVETRAPTPETRDVPASSTPSDANAHAPQATPTAPSVLVTAVQPTSTPTHASHGNAPGLAPSATPVPPSPTPTATPAPQEQDNFHVPNVSTGPMNDLEKRLFDGLNAERAAAGLAPYAFDAGLSKVARTRSQQMVDQGYFAHRDPFGYSMYVELLALFGFRYAWAGENLAMNNYGDHESPERAVAALMNSPSHRANILSSTFSRVGVGVAIHPDGRKFYTMIFLTP